MSSEFPPELPEIMPQAEAAVKAPRRTSIGKAIKARFADGKWHALEVIAKKLEADPTHVRDTLDRITKASHSYFGLKAERKKVGTHFEYRIFKQDKTVSSHELKEKLAPIVEALQVEGRKNQVTMSVMAVAVLASKLRKLLDEWT